MSKYTTELRYVLETYAGLDESEGNDKVEEIIENGMPLLFDFELPIFDSNYAEPLEKKICRHFYTREIGYETVGRFKLGLRTKLIEILPYYNKLYESELLKINPLQTYKVNKTSADTNSSKATGENDYSQKDKRNTTGTNINNGVSENVGKNSDRFSDTPNGSLTDIENNTYLSSASIKDNKETLKNSTNNVNTEANAGEMSGGSYRTDTYASTSQYVEKVCGINGISESKLLQEYRKTFLNIDMMIINELETLFMQLW